MKLTLSFPDDIDVYPGQLKSFNESVNDTKCLLKVEAISICFDNNLFFSSNIIISCILLFSFENYGLHAFKNVLDKVLQFGLFIQISDFPPSFAVA